MLVCGEIDLSSSPSRICSIGITVGSAAVGGDGGDPVIIVIGVAADPLYAVDSLGKPGQIIVDIVAITHPEDKETREPSPCPP